MSTRTIATLPAAALVPNTASTQDFEGGPPTWIGSSWFLRRDVELSAVANANAVDVRTGAIREGVTIAFWGGVIEVVDAGVELRGVEAVDATGLWIIPGLMDLHAHVIPPSRFFPRSRPPEETLATLLDHGVTTIRGLPFLSESAVVWSARVNAGLLAGPNIVPARGSFEREPERT